MIINWKDAVKNALGRYSSKNATILIKRRDFIVQELERIIKDTGSTGSTPTQTISRILQELRDEQFLFFSDNIGEYVLNSISINVANEDLPDDVLVNAIQNEKLILGDAVVSSEISINRVRKGTSALRKSTLQNYKNCCALCDINDSKLLVTSHIARWTDRPEARGLLSNTICFCTLHDKLFEHGYFALLDNMQLIWKQLQNSKAIEIWRNSCTSQFKIPTYKNPSLIFTNEHRKRVGLNIR